MIKLNRESISYLLSNDGIFETYKIYKMNLLNSILRNFYMNMYENMETTYIPNIFYVSVYR